MKKSNLVIIGLVILAVAAGGYVVLHKSPKTTPPATTSQTQSDMTNNTVLTTKSTTSVGQYLADPNDNTLYTYGADTSGVSNCTASCLANWPAYQDKGATTGLPANVGTIRRSDNGETQYTYMGLPLYTFVGDSKGQVTGNNVSNFRVAKP